MLIMMPPDEIFLYLPWPFYVGWGAGAENDNGEAWGESTWR